uniref:Uncharacterized protein n=1 Tax=Kalanchoe fedtschenkoi TaxID=63787 RepID=A0A7N0ZW69_KALFE
MGFPAWNLLFIVASSAVLLINAAASAGCSNGQCGLLDECSKEEDCGAGLHCSSCTLGFSGSRCVRSAITDQFKLLNNSLPFNRYAYLTTHNAFAIEEEPSHTGVPRVTLTNQEDNITQQLHNGVRALMLDTYDFEGDIWLCHSPGGKCHDVTAFVRKFYGDGGMKAGECPARKESAALGDKTKPLVLVNYFRSVPLKPLACEQNSGDLIEMLKTCRAAAGNRWANFVAVDYYKRSEGGGSFQAVDMLNAKLLCGCDDLQACAPGSTSGACTH